MFGDPAAPLKFRGPILPLTGMPLKAASLGPMKPHGYPWDVLSAQKAVPEEIQVGRHGIVESCRQSGRVPDIPVDGKIVGPET